MKTIAILLALAFAGCASAPHPDHPFLFCASAVASTDRGFMQGFMCQPVPDGTQIHVINPEQEKEKL